MTLPPSLRATLSWTTCVFLALSIACSPPPNPDAWLMLDAPPEGLAFNRADDLDPDQAGVQVEATVKAIDLEGSSVVAAAVGDTVAGVVSGAVPARILNGQARVRWTVGASGLVQAQVTDGKSQGLKSIAVQVAFDPTSTACRFVSPAPATVWTAADDSDPAVPGFQHPVVVRCAGIPTGDSVALTVDGAPIATRPLANTGDATFASVDLGAGEHTLVARVGNVTAQSQVRVETTGCQLSLSPASGTVFNARGEGGTGHVADLTPGAPLQARLTVTASSACAGQSLRLVRDAQEVATIPSAAEGTQTFDVELPEGRATYRVVTGAGDAASPGTVYVVDSVVPALTLTDLADGALYGDRHDVDPSTEGLQLRLAGTFEGIDPGTEFRLELVTNEGPAELVTDAIGDDGAFSVVRTLPDGTHRLTVSAARASGSVASATLTFRTAWLNAAVSLVGPDAANVNLSFDADPQTPGLQIPVDISAVNLDASSGSVACGGQPVPFTVQGGRATALVTWDAGPCGAAPITCVATVVPAGGVPVDSPSRTWNVDSSAPDVRLPGLSADQILSDAQLAVTADLSCLEEAVQVSLERDGVVLTGPTSGAGSVVLEAVILEQGVQTLLVRVEDAAGNATLVALPVDVDSIPPQVAFVSPAPDAVVPVRLGVQDDVDPSTPGVQLDVVASVGGEPVDVATTLTVGTQQPLSSVTTVIDETRVSRWAGITVPEGASTLRVCAADRAGYETCVDQAILVQTGAPVCNLVSPVDGDLLGVLADTAPDASGVQTAVEVQTDLEAGQTVDVTWTGAGGTFSRTATADGSGRILVSDVTFDAGAWTVTAACHGVRGAEGVSLPVSVEAGFDAPLPEIVSPADGAVLNASAIDVSADDGFQIDVPVRVLSDARGASATLTVDCGQGPTVWGPLGFGSGVAGSDTELVFAAVTLTDTPADGQTCDLQVTVQDRGGNVSAPVVHRVRVDRVTPVGSIEQPVDGTLLTSPSDADPSTAAFELDRVALVVDDPTAQVTLTAAGVVVGSTPERLDVDGGSRLVWTAVPLVDGPNDLVVTWTDAAGNTGSAQVSVVVDRDAGLVIAAPADGSALLAAQDLEPAIDGFQWDVRLAGARLSGVSGQLRCDGAPVDFTLDAAGEATVRLSLADVPCEGRQVRCEASVTPARGASVPAFPVSFTLDNTPPALTLTAPRDGAVLNVSAQRVEATVGCPGEVQTARLSVGGAAVGDALPVVDGAVAWEAVSLPAGASEVQVSVSDAAGNVSTATVQVRVDTEAPVVALVDPEPAASATEFSLLGPSDDQVAAEAGLQRVIVVAVGNEDVGTPVVAQVLGVGDQEGTVLAGPFEGVTADETGPSGVVRVARLTADGGEGVSLPVGDALLRACATDAAGNQTCTQTLLRVNLTAPACRIAGLADGDLVGAGIDLDPATPGVQLDVVVDTDLGAGQTVSLSATPGSADARVVQATADGSGRVVFAQQTLDVGAWTLQATCTGLRGNVARTESVRVTSRLAVPPLQVVAPTAAAVFNLQSTDTSTDDGFQTAVQARVTAPEVGLRAFLAVDCGSGVQNLTAATVDDASGEVSWLAVTLSQTAAEGSACALTVELEDRAGNRAVAGRVSVRVDRVAPALSVVEPVDGLFLGAGHTSIDRVRAVSTEADVVFALAVGEAAPVKGSSDVVPTGSAAQWTAVEVPAGDTVLQIQATDAAGNVATVERQVHSDPAATVAITAPAADAVVGLLVDEDPVRAGAQVRLTVEAPGFAGRSATGSVSCLGVDSVPFVLDAQGMARPVVSVDVPTCGVVSVRCQVSVAAAGGPSTVSAVHPFAVDLSAPVVRIVNVADGVLLRDASPDVSFQTGCVDETAEATLERAGVVIAGPIVVRDGSATFADVALPQGVSDLRVRVLDEAQNESSASVRVSVDSVPPSLSFVTPAPSTDGTATRLGPVDDVDATATGLQARVELSLPAEADGTRVVLTVPGGATTTATVTGAAAVFDAVTLPEGVRTLEACATDAAGNETCDTLSVDVRTGRPTCALAAPVDGALLGARADLDPSTAGVQTDVRVTTDLEAGATVVLSMTRDGSVTDVSQTADGSGAVNFSALTLAEGTWTLQARCEAPRGAIGTAPSVSVRARLSAPALAIVSPVDGARLGLSTPDVAVAAGLQLDVPVSLAVAEAGATASLTVDCGAGSIDAGSVALDAQGRGTFAAVTVAEAADCALAATVQDAAGNLGTPVVTHVSVDLTAPAAVVAEPADGAFYGAGTDADASTPGFQLGMVLLTTTDATATLSLEVDGQATTLTPGSVPGRAFVSGLTLAAGTHTLRATATDAAGNATSTTTTVQVDPAAELRIVSPAAGVLGLTADADAGQPGFQLAVRVSAPALAAVGATGQVKCGSVSAPLTWDAQGESTALLTVDASVCSGGTVTCSAQAAPPVGPAVSASAVSVTVDGQAPAVTWVSPVSGTVLASASTSIQVRSDCAGETATAMLERGGAVLSGPVSLSNGLAAFSNVTLMSGSNALVVRVTDAAGNTGTAAATLVVDDEPPVVDITDPSGAAVVALGPQDDQSGSAGDGLQRNISVVVDNEAVGTSVTLRVGAQTFTASTQQVSGHREAVFTAVTLAEGTSTLQACATDPAGTERCDTQDVSVRTRLATCTITSPLSGIRAGTTADRDASLAGVQLDVVIATDLAAGESVDLTLTPASGAPVTTSAVATGSGTVTFARRTFAEGAWTIAATCRGPRGADGVAAPATLETDLTPPVVSIAAPIEGAVLNLLATDTSAAAGFQIDVPVAITPAESGARATLAVQCGGGAVTSMGPMTLSATGTGTFTGVTLVDGATCDLTVAVTDALGNVSVPVRRRVSVDRTAPTLAIQSPADGASYGGVSDADAGTEGFQLALVNVLATGTSSASTLTLNGAAVAGGSRTEPNPGQARTTWGNLTLPEGSSTFVATVADTAGNTAQATVRVTVDTSRPTVRITSLLGVTLLAVRHDADPASPGLQYTIRLDGDKLVDGTVVRLCSPQGNASSDACALAGGFELAEAVLGSGGALLTNVTLPEGTAVTVVAEAVDTLGNSATSAPVTLRVDTQPPVVTSLSLLKVTGATETALDVSSGTVVLGRASDSNAATTGFQARVRAQVSGMNYAGASPTLQQARLIDTFPTPGTVVGTALVQTDGSVVWDVTLAEGSHRLHVQVSDTAANPAADPDTAPATLALRLGVDLTLPVVSIVTPSAGSLLAAVDRDPASAGLQYEVVVESDAGAGHPVAFEVDGAEVARVNLSSGTTRVRQVLTLPEGAHTLTARSTDAAGNTGVSSSVAVQVDSIAPVVMLTVPAGTSSPLDVDPETEGFQLAVDVTYGQVESGRTLSVVSSLSGTIATATTGASGTASFVLTLSNGTQTLLARVTDASGNPGQSTPVSVTITGTGPAVRFADLSNPLRFGLADDLVPGGDCQVQVQVLCDAPDGAPVSVLVDGTPAISGTVGGGQVTFSGIQIPAGSSVGLVARCSDGGVTAQTVSRPAHCDLQAPSISITDPASGPVTYVAFGNPGGVTGASVRVDKQASGALEADLTVQVTDADGGSVELVSSLDGTVATHEVTGTGVQSVPLTNVTLNTTGTHTLSAIVRDAAGNPATATLVAVVDTRAPGAVADLIATVVDGRAGRVSLGFTAPEADGVSGGTAPVAGYVVRRAASAISDLTGWNAATPVAPETVTVAAPGAAQTIDVRRLLFGTTYHLAVRAVDAVGNLGPLVASAAVDLSMTRQTLTIPAGTFAQIRMAVGDLDGDGTDDLVAGSSANYSGGTANGRLMIYYGASTLGGAVDWTGVTNDRLGAAVNIGDVNGDGQLDLLVGASGNSTRLGRVLIYLGAANARLSAASYSSPDVTIQGPSTSFGIQVVTVDDLNGDGVRDVVIGSTVENTGVACASGVTSCVGRAYVMAGSSAWTRGTAVTVTATTAALGRVFTTLNDRMGTRLTSVGDMNADGAGDFAVTAVNTNPGHVFVVSGALARGDIKAERIGKVVTNASTSQFGFELASGGGDFTGDGTPDLAIAHAGTDDAGVYSGVSLASGIPAATLADGTVVGTSATPVTTLRLPAGDTRRFGDTVRRVRDLNGDGIDEVAVSRTQSTSSINEVRIWLGRSSTSSWGDADLVLSNASAGFGSNVLSGRLTGRASRDIIVGDTVGGGFVYSGPTP